MTPPHPTRPRRPLCRRPITSLLLPQLPTIIADNAGYDSADLVAQLRAAHQENRTTFGLSEWGPPCTGGAFEGGVSLMCVPPPHRHV